MARTRTEAARVLGGDPATSDLTTTQINTQPDNVYQLPLPSPSNAYGALTSSARLLPADRAYTPRYDERQTQAWNFYKTLEQLGYGVDWLAKMAAKVRLVACELIPGRDEPVPIALTDPHHPAVEALARLAGGVGGQGQLMHEFTIHYSVPGVCWLVGENPITDPFILSDPKSPFRGYEDDIPDEETWSVYGADELRVSQRKYNGAFLYEIRVGGPPGSSAEATSNASGRGGDAKFWRPISPDSLVIKCWRPDPQYGWIPTSPTIRGLGACVELDLVNKRIMATILSRLASNGVLLYDKERMSLPTRTNPSDPADGANSPGDLAQVFVDVAKQAIADPASPAACIPIPIGFSVPDLTDVNPKLLMQHITFGESFDEKLLKLRDSSVGRLATAVDLPPEIMLGAGGLNHWGAAQVEESAAKVNVTSIVEAIVYSLTIGYLYPMLRAVDASRVGPHGGRIIVWYDPSNIEEKPDKSQNVIAAFDREEISGSAMRREIGVEESDAPSLPERIEMLLRKQARQGSIEALQVLNGDIKLGDIMPTASPGVRPDDLADDGRTRPDGTSPSSRPSNAPKDTPDAPERSHKPGGDKPGSKPETAPSDEAPTDRTPPKRS